MTSLQQDIYQFWGYRFDFKEGDGKKPKAVYERLLAEIPQSLTEQRERCSISRRHRRRDGRGVLPARTSRRRTGTGRASRAASSSTSAAKPPDVEHLHDPEQLAQGALRRGREGKLDEKEKEMGTELLLRVFRHFYLEEIDRQWVEHLTNMEHLRDGIGLRGYGQRDPKQEYKKEGYDIFINMMAATSSNVCTKLFKVQVQQETEIERIEREDAEKHAAQQRAMQMRHGSEPAAGEDEAPAPRAARSPAAAARARRQPRAARGPEDRPQRPLPVRQRPEVQEVPRRRARRRGRRRRQPVDGALVVTRWRATTGISTGTPMRRPRR